MATIKGIYRLLNNQGTYDTVLLKTDASQVMETADREFVSPAQKAKWDAKADSTHRHTSAEITDATNANTANKIVKRDANGNFSAGIITADLSGNASTATKLQKPVTINGVAFDGSNSITIKADANSHNHDDLYKRKTDDYKITPKKLIQGENINGLYQSGFYVSDSDANSATIIGRPPGSQGFTLEVREIYGSGVSGRQIQIATIRLTNEVYVRSRPENGDWTSWEGLSKTSHNHDTAYAAKTHTHSSSQITDATNNNTANMIVKRDGNGNFSAGTITANLTGNASTATKLETAKNVAIGNATKAFDGSNNLSFSLSEIGAASSNHTHTLLIANSTSLGSGTNLNNITTPGAYFQDANANAGLNLNYPEAKAGSLVVYKAAGIIQEYRVYASSTVYRRSYYNSSWTSWKKVYDEDNKPTAAEIGAAPTSHNHASNAVTSLLGYSKASTASALSTSDTLNIALGKLEKSLDNKMAIHDHPYRPDTWVPTWNDVQNKPTTFNPSSHTHGSNEVNKMTNYLKGSDGSPITTSDSLNSAISKLEVMLDGKSNTHTHPYRPNTWVPSWSEVTSKPTFATVATSGSYNDLTDRPTIISINDSTTTATTQTWSAKKINDSLAKKAASSHTHTTDQITGLGSAATLDAGTSANQVLKLDSTGKVPVNTLPSIAINTTQTATNEVDAMNKIVEIGDVVVLTSPTNSSATTYICVNDKATSFDEKFKALSSGSDSITGTEINELLKNKVDKVTGKGLSTNDYTTTEKNKLAGIEAGANAYVHPDTHSATMITETSSRRFITDTERTTWNGKANANHTHDNLYAPIAHDHNTENDSRYFRRDTANAVDVRLASGDGRGLKFWDSDNYKIYMSNYVHATHGGRLDSASDYNMYFKMAGGVTRGFVFKNDTNVIAQIDGSGKLYTKGEIFVNGGQVYHTNNKPTAVDIGAAPSSHNHDGTYLKTSGGTISGNITKTGTGAGFIISNGTSRTMMCASVAPGEHIFGGSNDSTNEVKDYVRVGSNLLNYTTLGNTYKIYHEGNKPSPADIGAAAASHGTHVTYATTTTTLTSGMTGSVGSSAKLAREDHTHAMPVIPTSLPANGGNADTVDGMHAAKFYQRHSDQVTSTSNWNNFTTPGTYKVQMSAWGDASLNGPNTANSGLYSYGLLVVDRADTNDTENRTLQTYYPHNTSHSVYTRMLNGTGWNAWTKVGRGLTASDVGAAASSHTHQTLTRGSYLTGNNYNGGTATTWAVDASTAATASKIVARDSAGDVQCRLVRSEYANQSTISGAMAFRVAAGAGADNYIRFCSDTTAIRTFLNVYSKGETYTKTEMDNRYVQKGSAVFSDTISITTPVA